MTGERGQALVFAVLLLGIAALGMLGLRDTSIRILEGVQDDRAGEAAAQAAAAASEDLRVTLVDQLGHDLDKGETAAFVARPDVIEAARSAAIHLARIHGRGDPSDVTLHAFGVELEVHLTLAGRTHIALLEPAP